jgi:hypothetical protein
VSFRQFADYLRQQNRDENGRGEPLDDDFMTKKYSAYKEGFMQRSLSKIYKEHKDEEW